MAEEDFDNNPFELNPFRHNYELIGQDKNKEELLYRILSGGMLLVEGKPGSGKTALLKYAINNFKGKGKIIYVDGKKVSKRLNIEKLLKRGLFKKTPKGMILLLDNVQNLTKKNCERVKYYYDQDYIKSVVFSTEDYAHVNFSHSIRDRIGKRIIRIRDMAKNDAIKMMRSRIGDNDALTNDYIKELLVISNRNPKQLLVNSKKLYTYLVKNKKKEVLVGRKVKATRFVRQVMERCCCWAFLLLEKARY